MHKDFSFSLVPEVILDRHPEYIELYKKAWDIASDHVLDTPGLPVEHHMDEGFAPDRNWIWDTCFMVHYCKYSPGFFPGIQSLDNFYLPLHDKVKSSCLIQHPDNPPLFAWVEYDYYRFTGDASRIHRNLVEKRYLQRHYDFVENGKLGDRCPSSFLMNTLQKCECGYFWSGIASGMDNTPRGNDTYTNLFWVDALAQQALSALYIARMAALIGESSIEAEYLEKYEEKKNTLNKYYFDERDGSYYDIHAATHDVCRILTPASFWPLMAEAASKDQAAKQLKTILDPELLGGEVPAPSVARNSVYFEPDGRYWRGGVWMPTSYMTAKAIEKYGYLDEAADFADKTVKRMSDVYRTYSPATIWEAYAPSLMRPSSSKHAGTVARPDFCGWSALGPISLLIENVIGVYGVDAVTKTVKYHHRKIGRHGVKRLKFGPVTCDIIGDDSSVTVTTDTAITFIADGKAYECKAGTSRIELC